MKRMGAVFILLLILPSWVAADGWDLAISPYGSYKVGFTSYELSYTYDSGDSVYSLLEFPLDTYYAGGRFKLRPPLGRARDFQIQGHFLYGLRDPKRVMKDHDWDEPKGFPKRKFSYTESEAELTALEASLEGRLRITGTMLGDFYLSAGYRYQRYSQDIIGYDGWQLISSGDTVDVSKDDILAMEYRINNHLPFIGFFLLWQPIEFFSLEWGSYLALLLVNDYDDHVLRNKLSTAAGWGFGLLPRVQLTIFPLGREDGVNPFISLEGEMIYLSANIEQTQKWYGDDPASSGVDDTGTKITGVDHGIRALQLGLGLFAGVELEL